MRICYRGQVSGNFFFFLFFLFWRSIWDFLSKKKSEQACL